MTRQDVQEYLSPAEFAEAHNVSLRTGRRWIAEGRIRAYRIGERKIGIRVEDSNAFAEPIPTTRDDAESA